MLKENLYQGQEKGKKEGTLPQVRESGK